MTKAGKWLTEKRIHLIFQVTLWLKGAFALGEIASGIFAYVVPKDFLLHLVASLTQHELAEDPHDFIANYLMHAAQHYSVGTREFTAIYLISHGAVKLWLIVGLLRERLWYYQTALVVFGLFIVYQLYRFGHTHSLFLLFITAVDVIVIVLTWHEYRYLRRLRATRL